MSEAVRLRTPWITWGLIIAVLAATVALYTANRGVSEEAWFVPLAVTMILGYSTVGAIVASRNPRNPIGWLMLGVGGVFVIGGFCDEYAVYVYVSRVGDELPGGTVAVWVINWIYAGMLTLLPLIGLLYPTGRVPGPRWRFLVPLTIGLGVVAAISSILAPTFVADAPVPILNPTGIEGFPADALGGWAWLGLLLALVASIAAIVVRYRRAAGEERQQIRWLAYVVITGVVVTVVSLISSVVVGETFGSTGWGQALAFLGFALVGIGVPAAMGVAILKYRLYDLDLVIKKAVVFGILVVALMAVGAVVLVFPGTAFVGIPSDEPGLILLVGVILGLLLVPLYRLSKRIADRVVYGGRAKPYEVMTQFSDRVAGAYSTDDVLPRMAQILGEGTGAASANVWLKVGASLRPTASWPLQIEVTSLPFTDDELPPMPGHESAFEVRHRGELLGALSVTMSPSDPMNASRERLIRDLASQAGLVLRNVRLIEELRESRRRIVTAQDERAKKLERDIHDGAQQQLVALGVKMRLLEPLVDRDPTMARELVEQLQAETTDALENLRDLARGIYPPLLADRGLAAALDAQARKSALPVALEQDGVRRYPQEVEATIYFCVLEAMQNISKYANATAVRIALWERDGRLGFEVRDDGVGFDPGSAPRGTGLQGMADRLDAVGGELRISSAPGRGTAISGAVSLPGNAESADPPTD